MPFAQTFEIDESWVERSTLVVIEYVVDDEASSAIRESIVGFPEDAYDLVRHVALQRGDEADQVAVIGEGNVEATSSRSGMETMAIASGRDLFHVTNGLNSLLSSRQSPSVLTPILTRPMGVRCLQLARLTRTSGAAGLPMTNGSLTIVNNPASHEITNTESEGMDGKILRLHDGGADGV